MIIRLLYSVYMYNFTLAGDTGDVKETLSMYYCLLVMEHAG